MNVTFKKLIATDADMSVDLFLTRWLKGD